MNGTVPAPGISAVVPVYNSEGTLGALVGRLGPVLAAAGPAYEVVLVNDGSRDGSWAAIEALAAEHAWVRGLDLMRNYGQHNALLAGVRAARYATVVTLDDDLQNPPEEIPRLLQALDQGCDVVYGTPERESHGLFRDLASQMTKLALQSAMGADTARKVSAFRAFRTRLREAFVTYQEPYVSLDVLLTWGSTRFGAVQVRHDRRTVGKSNYSMRKLVVHALNMMTGFSTLPLQLASLVGFALTLVGLALFGYVVVRYLIQGTTAPGFPFLASMLALFSGAQLFFLGIIGEYLARIHFRTMGRPSYAIRATDGHEGYSAWEQNGPAATSIGTPTSSGDGSRA